MKLMLFWFNIILQQAVDEYCFVYSTTKRIKKLSGY